MQRTFSFQVTVDEDTFSILGRIERDATQHVSRQAQGFLGFQYPRSDRAGCNHQCCPIVRYRFRPFSILGRIERDATDLQNWLVPWSVKLSVSSVGSSGMQPGSVGTGISPPGGFQYPRSDRAGCNSGSGCSAPESDCFFQYPRSDRAGCNHIRGPDLRQLSYLSVSSVGSSGMQLVLLHSTTLATSSLSVSSVGSSGMQRRR